MFRSLGLVVILFALSGALIGPDCANAQTKYLVPLGTGSAAIPRGLNNSGQVLLSTGVYSGGTFTPFPAGFSGSAINAQGHVAGITAAGDLALYSNAVVTDLAVPPGPAPMSGAQPNQFVFVGAINVSDEIVGTMFDFANLNSGFVYQDGAITPIRPVLNSAAAEWEASGLNDSGVITGCQNSLPGTPNEAYRLTNGVVTDLGPGCGFAINVNGQIAGFGASGHVTVFTSGGVNVLTEPPPFRASQPMAINGAGQIVGNMQPPGGKSVGFFYNGVMTDINSLLSNSDPLKTSVKIDTAIAINDGRLLLLSGHDSLGNNRQAYLLQAPWLDITPGPLAFPGQQLGITSAPQVLTLTNSGTTPLTIDSISSTAEFSQTNACAGLLAAGANCTVSLTFSPVATAGDRTSILDVVTDGATITVPLSGSVAITISLSAGTTQPTSKAPFTITWNATPGSTCNASGGTNGDGWAPSGTAMNPPPPLPPAGSATVTEPTPGTYMYMMSCAATSQNATSRLSVTVVAPASGGGAIDPWSLLALSSVLWLKLLRARRAPREIHSRLTLGRQTMGVSGLLLPFPLSAN